MPLVSVGRPATKRATLAIATSLGMVATAIVLTGAASGAPSAAPAASGQARNVIVLLRNQHTDLKMSKGTSSARLKAFQSDQKPLISKARTAGGKNVHGFDTVNGFAATLTPSEQASLAADPSVAAVYPDLMISGAPRVPQQAAASPAASGSSVSNTVCPSNPAQPLLEPDALQLTNTAFLDSATPQAQNIVDGTGVKVAFIADGLDINNQDFIRADGSHVFIDYQDFSGEGPDAPSDAAEAFGDASAIAAQGLHSYDLADWVSVAHPLPPGCTITVRGMAPGASLIGLKVFGNANSAPTSRFIEAIDYAVTDGADVLNESFGGNPYPDNGDDPISLADKAAVAAGVTVVSSSGDAGTTGTIGSPSDVSGVIGVGASTDFQSYAQTTGGGIQLSNGSYVDNNISGLSSGGITQAGTVPDLVAPGDLGWALCTADTSLYEGCASADGNPAAIQQFGGTSQSSPLTSGAAALVIEAYENTHHGVRPTPALVKQLIVSTATDLGHPATEQGSGLLNALAAVQAAESWHDANGKPARVGDNLVASKTQLTMVGNPYSSVSGTETITNDGADRETVYASTRTLHTVKTITGTTHMNTATDPAYLDAFGIPRTFVTVHFTVPKGIDRLTMEEASDTGNGAQPVAASRIILVDPNGVFTAYSIPQGAANYANTDARYPAAGTWTAYIAMSQSAAFDADIPWAVQLGKYVSHGTVSPSKFTLAPGASKTVRVRAGTSNQPSDLSASVQFTTKHGSDLSVPMTIRSVVPARPTTFTGTITGGNGRAFFGPAQTNDYYIDVPRGKQNLSVGVKIKLPRPPTTDDLEGYVIATLEGPNGQTYGYDSNFNDGNIQFYRMKPQAGRWILTIEALNPVEGNLINTPFKATVNYNGPKVSATGLPTSQRTKLAQGAPVTVPVKITNTGSATLNYYADPRLSQTGTIQLSTLNPANTFPLPQPVGLTPQWQVPSQSTLFSATVNADQPVNMDVFYFDGEPDLYSPDNGHNSATVTFTASEVSPGLFGTDIGQSGPFTGPAPAGTANLSAYVQGKLFDLATSSDTADIMISSAVAQSPALALVQKAASNGLASGNITPSHNTAPSVSSATLVSPVGGLLTLQPGQSGIITVTITPTGAAGSVVSGHLYIDTFDLFTGAGDETIDLPYTYTVS